MRRPALLAAAAAAALASTAAAPPAVAADSSPGKSSPGDGPAATATADPQQLFRTNSTALALARETSVISPLWGLDPKEPCSEAHSQVVAPRPGLESGRELFKRKLKAPAELWKADAQRNGWHFLDCLGPEELDKTKTEFCFNENANNVLKATGGQLQDLILGVNETRMTCGVVTGEKVQQYGCEAISLMNFDVLGKALGYISACGSGDDAVWHDTEIRIGPGEPPVPGVDVLNCREMLQTVVRNIKSRMEATEERFLQTPLKWFVTEHVVNWKTKYFEGLLHDMKQRQVEQERENEGRILAAAGSDMSGTAVEVGADGETQTAVQTALAGLRAGDSGTDPEAVARALGIVSSTPGEPVQHSPQFRRATMDLSQTVLPASFWQRTVELVNDASGWLRWNTWQTNHFTWLQDTLAAQQVVHTTWGSAERWAKLGANDANNTYSLMHSPPPRFFLSDVQHSFGMRWEIVHNLLQEFGVDELRIVEVGVFAGHFSKYLLERFPKLQLIGVDPYVGSDETFPGDYSQTLDPSIAYANAASIYEPYGERASLWATTSQEAVKQLPDESVHAVFIDGCHFYECVEEDLRLWRPKVMKGGLVAGHDFSPQWPGVVRAVWEARPKQRVFLGMDWMFWWIED